MTNVATQFKRGNKFGKGAPKKEWTVAALIREAMDDKILNPEGKKEIAKKIVYRKLVKMAADGDVVAIKEINNRLDGMPKQGVEIEGEITHIIITEEEDE